MSADLDLHLVDSAVRPLERLATMQPYDEDVHRRLMKFDIIQDAAVMLYGVMRRYVVGFD
jgi:DNA-binding SARP family transcriptional activator